MSLFHVFIFFQELYVVLIFVLSECMEMVNSYVFVFFFLSSFIVIYSEKIVSGTITSL